jgi:hypothetical protein
LVCYEVGHGLGGLQPRSSCAWVARRSRLANQSAGPEIFQGVDLIDRDQARDTAAAHRHDDLGAALDMLDVAAEPVVQLTDADLALQRLWMWRHRSRLYALHGETGVVTVFDGRPEFRALERAARRSGLSRARVREYLPLRMLEVEATANAVYAWAADRILERRRAGQSSLQPIEDGAGGAARGPPGAPSQLV